MRRSFTRGVEPFVTAVFVTALRRATCLLCDANYDSWGNHAASASHIARTAICRTYVSPERHNSMMQQLWRHIRLDFGYIDEVTHKKEDRRRGRLASTMRHLRDCGVLNHSLPRLLRDADNCGASFVVTEDMFVNFMLVGEGYARQETLDRIARLMPCIEAVELDSVVQYVLSSRRLAWLFDRLEMKLLLTRDASNAGCVEKKGDADTVEGCSADTLDRSGDVASSLPRLRQEEKAVIIFSFLGELQMYSRQDRSHSVATKAAADQLVLNVLGTHVMENIVAELVHAVLQSVVEEGTPVWRAHCDELKEKMFEGTRATPPPLASSPAPAAGTAAAVSESCEADLLALCRLDAGAAAAPLPQTTGRRVWHEVTRELTFELTVPNPVNKTATFAPAAPRLLSKMKTADAGK